VIIEISPCNPSSLFDDAFDLDQGLQAGHALREAQSLRRASLTPWTRRLQVSFYGQSTAFLSIQDSGPGISIETKRRPSNFEDSSPLDIVGDVAIAVPTKSSFQTLISIRVRARAAWAVTPGGAQAISTSIGEHHRRRTRRTRRSFDREVLIELVADLKGMIEDRDEKLKCSPNEFAVSNSSWRDWGVPTISGQLKSITQTRDSDC
jgi:hypothetical protein